MARTPMIAGNWKMNTTVDRAVDLVNDMLPGLDAVKGVDKVICPPFVSIKSLHDLLKKSSVKLGAQNMYFEEKGAFAGMCDYVILGHSERRHIFGENEALINQKIQSAIKNLVRPIFCVGETLEQNETGCTEETLTHQVMASCDKLYFFGGLVIAYEPVWAIGTGKSATAEQAQRTISFIRQLVRHRHGDEIANAVRILYGGSVTAANIDELMRQPDIDGALVGGASLKADEFVAITRQAAQIRAGFE
jgi:triosephosphate isomerase